MALDLSIEKFVKTKEFLICIDSDGTAMDSMTVKHIKCFGPCFIEEWGLQAYKEVVLNAWNEINLYSKTRGENRFLGLLDILTKFNKIYLDLDDLAIYKSWVKGAKELSNSSLSLEIKQNNSETLIKALNWSVTTNKAIKQLAFDDKKPFLGVAEFLSEASKYADIAIVSSAGQQTIYEEWEHYDLLKYVGVLACQEAGSKKSCIKKLIKKGYTAHNVMKIGDTLPDLVAAEGNKVLFYPIMPGCEYKAWSELKNEYLLQFLNGTYKIGQAQLVNGFRNSFY